MDKPAVQQDVREISERTEVTLCLGPSSSGRKPAGPERLRTGRGGKSRRGAAVVQERY